MHNMGKREKKRATWFLPHILSIVLKERTGSCSTVKPWKSCSCRFCHHCLKAAGLRCSRDGQGGCLEMRDTSVFKVNRRGGRSRKTAEIYPILRCSFVEEAPFSIDGSFQTESVKHLMMDGSLFTSSV